MLYRIDFLDYDDTPLFGYMEAVSPYWAQLQFNDDYDFEITGIEEYRGELDDDSIML